MSSLPSSVNWSNWLERWDRQQRVYLPEREQRFALMLDVLEALLAETFVAVDLASGPGSLSQRLLTRFPYARCIAVDLDPVLLALGQGALDDMQGRLRWVEADLRNPHWRDHLGEERVDAVLSTTALHWLPPATLVALYEQLAELIRPGGVFLNGDHFSFRSQVQTFKKVVDVIQERKAKEVAASEQAENWRAWWDALAQEPGMQELFAERERRFAWRTYDQQEPLLELHEAALHNAGFREVGVIWQYLDNCVLLAVR